MADLKKCPFCGSDAMFRHIFENPDKCMVGCRGCDVVIDGVFPNELEAEKEWNDQVLADEIAALRAENERLTMRLAAAEHRSCPECANRTNDLNLYGLCQDCYFMPGHPFWKYGEYPREMDDVREEQRRAALEKGKANE